MSEIPTQFHIYEGWKRCPFGAELPYIPEGNFRDDAHAKEFCFSFYTKIKYT